MVQVVQPHDRGVATIDLQSDGARFVAGAAGKYPAKLVEKRHLWLAALALGKNPFTDDVPNAPQTE